MSEHLNFSETQESRPVHEVVTSLKDLMHKYESIGYVLGLNNGRILKEWVRNATQHVDPITETKLMVTESLARAVYDEQRPHVSSAWLIGCHPLLGEVSPAELIQNLNGSEEDAETIDRLQHAARQWMAE